MCHEGSILSSIIMASILALLNASCIKMNYIPIPITCCYHHNPDTTSTNDYGDNIQIVFDRTKEEELSYGVVTFVFLIVFVRSIIIVILK